MSYESIAHKIIAWKSIETLENPIIAFLEGEAYNFGSENRLPPLKEEFHCMILRIFDKIYGFLMIFKRL